MKAKFHIESGQPQVLINGEWNALSLFLESDASFEEAKRHIELKKNRQWMGNASTLCLISGSLFKVSTELDLDLNPVEIHQKQLLTLIKEWVKFEEEQVPHEISV